MNFLKTSIIVALLGISTNAGKDFLPDESKRTLYRHRTGVIAFAEKMQEKHNISKEYVLETINQVYPTRSAITNSDAPAEIILTWAEYRDKLINDVRVNEGKELYKKYTHELQFLEKKYGVPPEVVLAISGIETSYGKNQGKFKLIDTLTTLSFDYPRRKNFFQRELEHLFLMTEKLEMDIHSFKGSYAGAFGIPQFMPSSYLAYAKSFSNETSPNIWNNKLDAFASIANYLNSHNWDPSEDYLYEATYKGKKLDFYKELKGLKAEIDFKTLKKDGWKFKNTKLKINNDEKFLPIVLPIGNDKYEFYLGSENFYTISRYNPRLYYTMSVAILAKKIKYD